MNCKKCGNSCPDGYKFCLHCGAPLSQTAVNFDPTTDERPSNRLKFSGTTTDDAKKSTVKLSGGIPISQCGGSFRVRQNFEQKSMNQPPEAESASAVPTPRSSLAPDPTPTDVPHSSPTPIPIPEPHPNPSPTSRSALSPDLPRKKWSVGLIILLIILILSFCGLAGVLLYHFGVIGDQSPNETTAQAEAPEEVHDLYEAYFCENFLATDRACLVDVTHDGIDEMLVIQFSDEVGTYIYGYVYSVDEKGDVKRIYSTTGSNYNIGGYFQWFIKETTDGFILAREEGHWSTGLGELYYYEYYLNQDGTINILDSAQVSSLDYNSVEDSMAACGLFNALVEKKKSDFYTLYSAPAGDNDPDTLGSYPMNAADYFDISLISDIPELQDGEVLLYGEPAPVMLYASKMVETENLDNCYLYDIDGDGLSELILHHQNSMGEPLFEFYTCQNGVLTSLGTLDALCRRVVFDGNRLLLQYAFERHEEIQTVRLSNGCLSIEFVSERDLKEREDYTDYNALPASSYGCDPGILSYTYTKAQNSVVTPSEYFIEKDGYFTDGKCAYGLLSDGTLIGFDGVTGTSTVYGSKFLENHMLFGVTKKSLFFRNTAPDKDRIDIEWRGGNEIYSLSKETFTRTDYAGAWEGQYQAGYILLKSFRSDVSPSFLCVIDNDDVIRVSYVAGWDLTVYDGHVYLLEVCEDLYASPITCSVTEYRLDPDGLSEVALIGEGRYYYAYYTGSSIKMMDMSISEDVETLSFDIPTGKPVT